MSAGGRKIEKNVPQFRTTSKQSLFDAAFEGIFDCDARDDFPRICNRYRKKNMDWNNMKKQKSKLRSTSVQSNNGSNDMTWMDQGWSLVKFRGAQPASKASFYIIAHARLHIKMVKKMADAAFSAKKVINISCSLYNDNTLVYC